MEYQSSPIFQQAQQVANQTGQQLVIIRDSSDGKYYAAPAIGWMNADGRIEGIPSYTLIDVIDPDYSQQTDG